MRKVLECLTVIMGTIIGAGFASGREIVSFFVMYGTCGAYGIIVSSSIMSLLVVSLLFTMKEKKIKRYDELLHADFFKYIAIFLSVSCFCIMISAASTLLEELTFFSLELCIAFSCMICYIVLIHHFDGIKKVHQILVPLIVAGILCTCWKIDTINLTVVHVSKWYANWLVSAVLYAGYNILVLIPILVKCHSFYLTNHQIGILGIILGLLISALMFSIYRVNILFGKNIFGVELPQFYVASTISYFAKWLYGIVTLGAIFTTAFSCGYTYLSISSSRFTKRNAFILCLVSVFCSRLGFSKLIDICYPILGVCGLVQILLILADGKVYYDKKKNYNSDNCTCNHFLYDYHSKF